MKAIKSAGGVTGCPADAVNEIKSAADYICVNRAGEGAFREFSEYLIKQINYKNDTDKRVSEAVEYIKSLDMGKLNPGKYKADYIIRSKNKALISCRCFRFIYKKELLM